MQVFTQGGEAGGGWGGGVGDGGGGAVGGMWTQAGPGCNSCLQLLSDDTTEVRKGPHLMKITLKGEPNQGRK